MSAFEAHCRAIVEDTPRRLAAIAAQIGDMIEAAGETHAGDLMEDLIECRASIARAIKGPEACEREAMSAWHDLVRGNDFQAKRIRRHIGVMLANIAADIDTTIPLGGYLYDMHYGPLDELSGLGGRKPFDPRAIAKRAARRAGKAKGGKRTTKRVKAGGRK